MSLQDREVNLKNKDIFIFFKYTKFSHIILNSIPLIFFLSLLVHHAIKIIVALQ